MYRGVHERGMEAYSADGGHDRLYVKSTGQTATYREGAWEIAGGQVAAIPGPSGGSNVDVEARAAIDQVLAALRHHGLIES